MTVCLLVHFPSVLCQWWGNPSFNTAHSKPSYKKCNMVHESASEDAGSEPSLINTAENRRTVTREGGTSTHRVHSDAGHEISHGPRQPQFLHVGQWPTKMTPAFATPSVSLETTIAIRRTGTELQDEEESVGTIHSRTCSDDRTHSEHQHDSGEVSQPHNTPTTEDLTLSKDRGQKLSSDYYQFEWFWILIGMVLLMVSETIMFIFVVYWDAVGPAIILVWPAVLISVAIGLCSSLLYTGIFVVLTEHHEAIEKCLDRYARVRPWLQRTCLRVCTYAYACGVLAAVGYLLYYFTYVNKVGHILFLTLSVQ